MTSVLYDVPGPRARRRNLIGSVVGTIAIIALLAWVGLTLAEQGIFEGRRWEIFRESDVWQALGRGLLATLRAAATAAVLACLLGAVLCGLRLSQSAVVRRGAQVFIEIFRGLPVLLLMYFPLVMFTALTPFMGAVIGLTLYNGTIIAEILRSGVRTLPSGQREAGLAIGLTPTASLRLIELPQSVRIMLPSLISQLVVLLKDTSLAFIITYEELLRTVVLLRDFYGNQFLFPIFFVGVGIYITINFAFSSTATFLARRGNRKAAASPASTQKAGAPAVDG